MLRFTTLRLGVSPFSLFMMEQKKNPALVGLPIARRGRMLGRLYRGLSPRDRAALEKRAAARASFKSKRKVVRPKGKSAYNRFVKKHYSDTALKHLRPQDKVLAIANMWRAKNGDAPLRAIAKKSKSPKKAKKTIAKKAKKVKAAAAAQKKKSAKVNKTRKTHTKAKSSATRPKKYKAKASKATTRKVKRAMKRVGKKTKHNHSGVSTKKGGQIFTVNTRRLAKSDIAVLRILFQKSRK